MILKLCIIAAFWFAPATLEDGRCSVCKRFGVMSTVQMNGFTTCTAMACLSTPTYDAYGNYVAPKPCNTCSSGGMCSRGHRVSVTFKAL